MNDLLSNLVRSALENQEIGPSLSEDEIIGNVYIYLLAGHETTAHSLAWMLALLAAYPDKQEALYEEIMEHDHSGDTVLKDYPKFRYALATYYETLRLFPPVQQIPKHVEHDTAIVFEKSNERMETGDEQSITADCTLISTSADELQDTFFGYPSLPSTPSRADGFYYISTNSSVSSFPSISTGSSFSNGLPFTQELDEALPSDDWAAREYHQMVIEKGTVIFLSPPGVRE
jgi:hypothetical protein